MLLVCESLNFVVKTQNKLVWLRQAPDLKQNYEQPLRLNTTSNSEQIFAYSTLGEEAGFRSLEVSVYLCNT